METQALKEIIGNLPFSGFNNLEAEKKNKWLETAEKAVKKLSVGNVLIRANPGSGKTAMAILTSFAFKKTLFATTSWELTMQHKELYKKITGTEAGAFIMKNKIPADKRVWDQEARITFVTTGILVNDLEAGKINLADYDLVVNDECDLAVGDHVAAKLARITKQNKVPMLCLTATLGSKKVRETIIRNCGIYEIIEPDISEHQRAETNEMIALDPVLEEIDKLFIDLLRPDFDYFKTFVKALEKREGVLCSQEEIEAIGAAIEAYFGGQRLDHSRPAQYFEAVSRFAYYRKLRAAYRKCLVNSYDVFLKYAEALEIEGGRKLALIKGDKFSKAAKRIIEDKRFQKIKELAWQNKDRHPKFLKLEEHITNQFLRHRRRVIFVDEKEAAYLFRNYFAEKHGLKTAAYVGGQTKVADKKAREELRLQINAGEFDVVFGTSAMERGVDLVIDEVINYSMAMERRSREQRGGRAGRFRVGHILNLCLKHDLERIYLFATTPPERRKKKEKPKYYFFQKQPYQAEIEFPG